MAEDEKVLKIDDLRNETSNSIAKRVGNFLKNNQEVRLIFEKEEDWEEYTHSQKGQEFMRAVGDIRLIEMLSEESRKNPSMAYLVESELTDNYQGFDLVEYHHNNIVFRRKFLH